MKKLLIILLFSILSFGGEDNITKLLLEITKLSKSISISNGDVTFIRQSKGIVEDVKNHLLWEDNNHTLELVDHFTAHQYCRNLKFKGFDDWSMPTKKELLYLTNVYRIRPSISNMVFKNTKSDKYWTWNTLHLKNNKIIIHWLVDFEYGSTAFGYSSNEKHYIRCVRNMKATP